jgi:hypothetical protein
VDHGRQQPPARYAVGEGPAVPMRHARVLRRLARQRQRGRRLPRRAASPPLLQLRREPELALHVQLAVTEEQRQQPQPSGGCGLSPGRAAPQGARPRSPFLLRGVRGFSEAVAVPAAEGPQVPAQPAGVVLRSVRGCSRAARAHDGAAAAEPLRQQPRLGFVQPLAAVDVSNRAIPLAEPDGPCPEVTGEAGVGL